MSKTGLLLSGGMDSVALAFWRKPDLAFTIDYGQLSAEGEVRASRTVCEELGIAHEVLTAGCRALGAGDMAGDEGLSCSPSPEWWPYRNQLLATLAAMRALRLGVGELWFGSVRTDGFHVDGTIAFYERLSALLALQEGGMIVSAPAAHLSTVELVRASRIPATLLAWTHSCHKAPYGCGACRGCYKYAECMVELGYVPA